MRVTEVHEKAAESKEQLASYKIITAQAASVTSSYRNLIYSKLLRSLRFGNDYFKLIDSDAYYQRYNLYITHLLAKPEMLVSYAVLSDDPDVVLGFSIHRGNILDYVHVHKDNRKLGIATKLIPTYAEVFTHITKSWEPVWRKKYPDMKFNPFV